MTRMSVLLPTILWTIVLAGCVTSGTHQQTVDDLEKARKASAQTDASFEGFKKQAAAQISALEEDKSRLGNAVLAAQSTANQSRAALETSESALAGERTARRQLDAKLNRLTSDHQMLDQLAAELRRERDLLQTKNGDLQRRFDTSQQELASARKGLTDADARIGSLDRDKEKMVAALSDSQNQTKDLASKLDAEHRLVTALQADKQRLMSGTTTAQDEIAKLQKRAGELETQATRAADLDKRVAEQQQELGELRQASADRESLAAKVTSLTDELEKTKQRVTTLTGDMAALGDVAAKTKQERDRLDTDVKKQQVLLQEQQERLKAESLEKARLAQERADKEAEIQRLTRTREDLDRALQSEISKGDIRIKQVRDRLTINMVDRVLFDSGQAQVEPAGLKVLKQVSDVLKKVTDKQIRIEGHTDNVPIGPRIKERFPTNWELSTARATSVVRYLIEEGGVDRSSLSAVGYSDTKPVLSNETEDGRQANRRIEIVLYPKDLSDITSQIAP
ncbi:MAG: OmpA family protein [Nitrospirae bacterium]|nr:OmpA family protein [Nitrospirota bacterium]